MLTQALPYIKQYAGKTVVIKYGGNAMISEELKSAVMEDIVLLSTVGIHVVLVHGGGPEINAMLKKIGKESRFVGGLRYTDRETMDVVEMVLAGKVNKSLVQQLEQHGGRAIGLSTFASWIGGTISALVLICVAPQLAKLALKFGPPEYFCLAVFGLTIIASISGKNMLKGIIAGLLGLLGVRLFIKVIQIKPYILTPIIFVLCILGSYALRNNMFDVGAMLLIAVVGYFFLKLEIPIAPIVLALILGPLAESNLRRSLLLSQGSASIFFTRPICIFFLVLALVSLCWPLLRKLLSGRKKQA